ncbi:hypothetical protein D3C85_1558400 [compost metagenome]
MQAGLLQHCHRSQHILQGYLPCLFPRQSGEYTGIRKGFNEIINIVGSGHTEAGEDIDVGLLQILYFAEAEQEFFHLITGSMCIQGHTAVSISRVGQCIGNDPDNRSFCSKIIPQLFNRYPCHNRYDCGSR